MEFRDLRKQYELLKADIDQAMMDVAASGAYIMGNPVKELEQEELVESHRGRVEIPQLERLIM